MKTLCALVCLLPASLIVSGTAHADEQTFVQDVHKAGVEDITHSENDTMLLKVGYAICTLIGKGMSPQDVAQEIYTSSHQGKGGISLIQAQQVVQASLTDLCPDGPTPTRKL